MAEERNHGSEVALPEMLKQVDEWWNRDTDFLANLCNVSAFLFHSLPEVSWLGWYVTESVGGDLTLGPFQGKPTLPRIGWGQGIVGSAAFDRVVQIVEDVRRFHGNLKDGLQTRSEVALPIIRSGLVQGVLAVKSQQVGRFGLYEAELFSAVAQRVSDGWKMPIPNPVRTDDQPRNGGRQA
ncbi:GAF domain-containing protein [Ferviditalea candida]|uniref:GAF domain-containing protein n=1 Tax=Ferviditalea candida TaxID=3108399 RepID=A0ABU5ZM80_9BACL|nr:GAF domain-containing protein [Paenibacillaceae bacterium T2]